MRTFYQLMPIATTETFRTEFIATVQVLPSAETESQPVQAPTEVQKFSVGPPPVVMVPKVAGAAVRVTVEPGEKSSEHVPVGPKPGSPGTPACTGGGGLPDPLQLMPCGELVTVSTGAVMPHGPFVLHGVGGLVMVSTPPGAPYLKVTLSAYPLSLQTRLVFSVLTLLGW
jgi:hypothetical protein